jgi:hypothetical protein
MPRSSRAGSNASKAKGLPAKKSTLAVTSARIERSIILMREQRVLLDSELALMYGVTTGALNQAVRRNIERFPDDFMFQLSEDEVALLHDAERPAGGSRGRANLKSQSVISSWGGSRSRPYAFTEQGVAMLSSVLRSRRAVDVNIEIMRAFVRLRGMLARHADLAQRLDELERKYDGQFRVIFDAIRALMEPPATPARKSRIGFRAPDEEPARARGARGAAARSDGRHRSA